MSTGPGRMRAGPNFKKPGWAGPALVGPDRAEQKNLRAGAKMSARLTSLFQIIKFLYNLCKPLKFASSLNFFVTYQNLSLMEACPLPPFEKPRIRKNVVHTGCSLTCQLP